MNISINGNFSQTSMQNARLLKPDDFQALFKTSSISASYDPALVQKVIKYMYDNAMINCLYAVPRGYVMKPYLHDLNVNSQANAMAWGTATAWMSK